ncbi:MAG: hypothetical protein ACXVPN_02705 [Bacteroidia bacterium]
MLYHLGQYISNSVQEVFKPAIGQRAKFTGNTGMALISTANTNLDGTGTIVSVITGASNGTHIETITIQALGTTTRGMVRLFITDGSTYWNLVAEVDIPAQIQSSIDKAFSTTLHVDFNLVSGKILAASTEKGESFAIVAEGMDLTYP